jgi:energy-coupling factor transport system ATP-binding protein
VIETHELTITYQGADAPTVHGACLRVAPGELVLLAGPTGCGKSTLLNALNGVLQHESQARLEGSVSLDGTDLCEMDLAAICRRVGSVFQDPGAQICTATPETEVAFGLENLAVDPADMPERIGRALAEVGLAECRAQPAATLSGGQKQRLVIACALALEPDYLLLDEPISQLDPRGAREILALLTRLRSDHGLGIVLVEHRLDETVGLADRVMLMQQGRIVAESTPAKLLADMSGLRELGLNVPHLPNLFDRLGRPERPLTADQAPVLTARPRSAPEPPPRREPLCRVRDLQFRYDRHGPAVFRGMDLKLRRGERIALMGANGSGKSTLLHLLSGIEQPTGGAIEWQGPRPTVGLVLQSPDLMLLCESVREELEFGPRHFRRTPERARRVVERVADQMSLRGLEDQAPFALSRGQRLRTAVASVLTTEPGVLLLDEPTTGQDRDQIERMMGRFEDAFELLLFCTHDVDTAARHADRVVLLQDGRVSADGPPAEVFFDEDALAPAGVRPTSLQRYAARLSVRALTVDAMLEVLR